jgi:hypothetical protein
VTAQRKRDDQAEHAQGKRRQIGTVANATRELDDNEVERSGKYPEYQQHRSARRVSVTQSGARYSLSRGGPPVSLGCMCYT